jgi:hypothetical protein
VTQIQGRIIAVRAANVFAESRPHLLLTVKG